jgi:hypothetical protein
MPAYKTGKRTLGTGRSQARAVYGSVEHNRFAVEVVIPRFRGIRTGGGEHTGEYTALQELARADAVSLVYRERAKALAS